ncbi:MAG: L,D-transpeptidase family protein [Gammaproteobacteria bacterium]|nr:L,D-transpeptidase family protein [Gammaproteobacteria bacterium]
MLAFLFSALVATTAHAIEYELRDDGGAIFGKVERIRTRYEDTLIEIARKYSLGYEELVRVNKGVDPWLPGEGTQVVIPGQRLLPPGEREGIVVNLPEHRMYFFPEPLSGDPAKVLTFPVSVGKMDWRTPIGVTKVVAKQKNPSWYPPESVRLEHEARGDPLPKVVGPGPDNPLGAHALRLAIPGGSYLIHGTNNPDAVGMAVTHGCLRMYPEDVAVLFDAVKVGTRVTLINEPLKMTKVDGEVWIEVHPPIDEQGQTATVSLEAFEQRLDELLGDTEVAINWDVAILALREASGIPVMIGLELGADPLQPPAAPPAGEQPIDKPT